MEDQLSHNLMESANTLPASMDAAHVDGWTKINDKCFITPAIDRLTSLQDKGFFERREKALDDRRESGDHFTPAMTPTPYGNSVSLFESQPAFVPSPEVPTSKPHDPIVERIEEILGVVGVHEIILGEQVAATTSLLEKTMAQVRQLHQQALLDITDAAQELRNLRYDLVRAKPPSSSPHHVGVTPGSASKKTFSATSVKPTQKSHERGHTVVAPVPRVAQECSEDLNTPVPAVAVNHKQAGDKPRSQRAFINSSGPQRCESCGIAAHAQNQPSTQPSVNGDGTLASPTSYVSSTGGNEQYPPSAEQKQPHADDIKNKHQQPVQRHSEHVKSMPSDKKTSGSTTPMIITGSVVNSISRDTAIPPTSAQTSSNADTQPFTPGSPPSAGAQPHTTVSAISEPVRPSQLPPSSLPPTGLPVLDAQTSTPDEDGASFRQAPTREPSPVVTESDVLPTKGIKRSSDSTTDSARKRTRQRIS